MNNGTLQFSNASHHYKRNFPHNLRPSYFLSGPSHLRHYPPLGLLTSDLILQNAKHLEIKWFKCFQCFECYKCSKNEVFKCSWTSWARTFARQFAICSPISLFYSAHFKFQTIIWPWKSLKPEKLRR